MEITYSTLDTIEEYDNLFRDFHIEYSNYSILNKNKNLIYLSAGLGLSNSIHEKFIKSIIEEYMQIIPLSNNRKGDIIRKYKAPNKINELVILLGLNLNEAFNLMQVDIQTNHPYISSYQNLISYISLQRNIRNNYMHGDFSILDDITISIFKENVLDFQEIHNFLFKMIRYSFLTNRSTLPNLS